MLRMFTRNDFKKEKIKMRKNNRWRKRILILVICLISMYGGIISVRGEQSSTVRTQTTSQVPKIKVVVSILPLSEFVEKVGGNKVEVSVMVPPGASPHTYEVTPKQMKELSKARLFVKVGSLIEFELSWIDKIIAINKNMLVIDSSQGIPLMGKNPHIWLSPKNAEIQVHNICEGLIKIDPANKEYYIQNKDAYLVKLNKLDRDIKDSLLKVKDRKFMVFHPAWSYFARDYNLKQISIEKEGKEPNAKGIIALIKQAKANNIKIIFVSPQFSVKSAEVIANEIGGRVAFIDPLAKDYIKNMYKVLDELVQGME